LAESASPLKFNCPPVTSISPFVFNAPSTNTAPFKVFPTGVGAYDSNAPEISSI